MICQERPNLSLSQPHCCVCTAFGELVPEFVDLLLRLAAHDERDGLGELEMRPAVQGRELLAFKLEEAVITLPFGPGPASP